MRTIHIEDNDYFSCHRVGMTTVELFMNAGWEPNKHMPPYNPGSLADDFGELLDIWQKGPENAPNTNWIIPPARGKKSQVVGNDYPHKARFNKWKKSDTENQLAKDEQDTKDWVKWAKEWIEWAKNATAEEVEEEINGEKFRSEPPEVQKAIMKGLDLLKGIRK